MIKYNIKSVDEMSIDELIGQVIMVGLPGLELDEHYKQFIKQYKIGNYILFARNYDNTKQMKQFMKNLYNYTLDVTGSFPLVSIDQEGGMVVRLFKDVTFPASPMTTSSTKLENAPFITGEIIGRDMLKLGVNLNLAPCLEVNENLMNPLVNVRGYAASKETVLKNATLFVEGLQKSGALSCIKHYPGAGSSTKDSHWELPIIEDSKETLLNYNMYPFVNLMKSDCLMSSHCIYKAFDEFPSTLSKVLLTETLRNKYGFEGLIISDGMEMKAISDHYGIGKGSVMALNAGCDILLLCHEFSEQKEAFDAVKKAVLNKEIDIELLKEKVRRINKAKEKVSNYQKLYFKEEDYIIIEEEHKIMKQIVNQSYTLIKGTKPHINDETLVIASNVRVSSIAEDEFDNRNLISVLKQAFPNNEVINIKSIENIDDFIKNEITKYNNVLIYSYDACYDKKQQEIINKVLDCNIETHVISLKGPVDRQYFNNLKNYSCLYEYSPNSIKAVVLQLKGEIELEGKLPL